MNCPHCPLGDRPCRGERWHVERLCQLLDPSRPDHNPAYADVVRRLSDGPKYPTLAEQAANLAGSLWEWATDGFRMASEAEQARRLAICAACPEWVPADHRCRICGCKTSAKVQLRTEHCPEGKW